MKPLVYKFFDLSTTGESTKTVFWGPGSLTSLLLLPLYLLVTLMYALPLGYLTSLYVILYIFLCKTFEFCLFYSSLP